MNRFRSKLFVPIAAAIFVSMGIAWLALRGAPRSPLRPAFAVAAGALAAAVVSQSLARRVLESIERTTAVAQRLEAGNLDARVVTNDGDERDQLAVGLNRMADALQGELERARDALEQREAVMAEMVEGVLVLDADERIVLVNAAFRELFDAWGEVAARPVVEVVRLPAIHALLEKARDGAGPFFDDLELRGHVARTVWARAARFPSEGPRAGTLAVFHDVTEIRRVDRIRRDFVANASHELRTPLTSIQGYAESLASGPMTRAEVESHLAVIQRNVGRMRDLIDDLIELSRIESGEGQLTPSRVDVFRLAQTLVADAGPRLARTKIEARVLALPPEQPAPCAWADRKALEQVLENLLTNAIRYSDEGAQVSIEILPQGERIEIAVVDTGIGIPADALDRIFERFYRVDASRSRAIGSTGLGLSIVRHLVQAMGGTIRVESELGRGSRFTFSVPRAGDLS